MHGVGRNKETGLSEVLNWEKALVLGVRKKADPQQGKDYKQIGGTHTESDQGTEVFCTGKECCHPSRLDGAGWSKYALTETETGVVAGYHQKKWNA